MNAMEISDNMIVAGCDGETIGMVDGVEGDRIRLTVPTAEIDEPRYIPIEQVETVDDGIVSLSVTAMQARAGWHKAKEAPQLISLTH